jgi:site-specific DNA recombinase
MDCNIAEVRSAIYVRQSSDRAGDELGIGRQRNDCRQLIAARGWQVAGEYVDNDVSATSRKPRPAFTRLLDDVRTGSVQIIVARDVDRLARRLSDLETVLEHCRAAGARVVTAREGVDTGTDAGRLVARILGSVAQGEAERKSRRQTDAQAQAAAQGRRVGGRRPFGYEQDGCTIVPEEAAAIRDGYADLLSGLPLAAIARDWNARGLARPQTLAPWGHDSVALVLRNARHAGLRRYIPAAERAKPGRRRPDEGIVGPASWPALVGEETWRAAVDLLGDPSRRRGTPGARQLLTGLARCGVCGELVHGGGASHGKPIYRCRSGRHVSRLAAPVDEYIGALVIARLSRADARDLLTAPDIARPDVPALREEAMALRARLDTVAAEFADDPAITPGQLRTITTRLRDRLAEVETELADAGRVDTLSPLLDADEPGKAWDAMGTERRRAVIDTLFTEVRLLLPGRGTRTFRPETVEVHWRGHD